MGYGIWLATNANIFKDRYIPPFQCASQIRKVFGSFKVIPKK
jgi:hypothetical protein